MRDQECDVKTTREEAQVQQQIAGVVHCIAHSFFQATFWVRSFDRRMRIAG